MKNLTVTPYQLSVLPWAAGQQTVYPLNQLPTVIRNKYAHVIGFFIDVAVAATYTTAPTFNALFSAIGNIIFSDGVNERINISALQLRWQLITETGREPLPPPKIPAASGNVFYVRAFVPLGPTNMAGWGTDYAFPVGGLTSGELRVTPGTLTQMSADTTAIAYTPRVTALVVGFDGEIRIPPFFERRSYNNSSNDFQTLGVAKYNSTLLHKQSLAVFAAGDLGNIATDPGSGAIQQIPAQTWSLLSQFDSHYGSLTFQGEPASATDTNSVALEGYVQAAAMTPLVSPASFQPVIAPISDGRISKLEYTTKGSLRTYWSGSFATTAFVVGRFLPQTEEAFAALSAAAAKGIGQGIARASKVKTLSGRNVNPARTDLVPYLPKALRY